MGVFSYADNTLGLRITPRIQRILQDLHKGVTPDEEDSAYLVNEASRYSTIANQVRMGTFKITDSMLEEEYEIRDVLGDLITELDAVRATSIDINGIYQHELETFRPNSEYGIEKLQPNKIESEVLCALKEVRELQENFNKNGDNLVVQAKFKHLKQDYGVNLVVTAESNTKDVMDEIMEKVSEVVEKQAKDKQDTLTRWKS